MNPRIVMAIALAITLGIVLGSAWAAQAPAPKDAYPKMAPLDQYLMPDRNAEIALARSAAPPSISRDATVVVLGSHGYETSVEGKNGFVCIVERGWMNAFDSSEFWSPKTRGPICFNPPAARTVLPLTLLRTRLVLAGKSKAEVKEGIKTAIEKKELLPLENGAMCYMMSKDAYLTDSDGHNMAHLMFYTPLMDAGVWGANPLNSSNELLERFRGSPLLLSPQFRGDPEPINVFFMGTGMWSDGTAAPVM